MGHVGNVEVFAMTKNKVLQNYTKSNHCGSCCIANRSHEAILLAVVDGYLRDTWRFAS